MAEASKTGVSSISKSAMDCETYYAIRQSNKFPMSITSQQRRGNASICCERESQREENQNPAFGMIRAW